MSVHLGSKPSAGRRRAALLALLASLVLAVPGEAGDLPCTTCETNYEQCWKRVCQGDPPPWPDRLPNPDPANRFCARCLTAMDHCMSFCRPVIQQISVTPSNPISNRDTTITLWGVGFGPPERGILQVYDVGAATPVEFPGSQLPNDHLAVGWSWSRIDVTIKSPLAKLYEEGRHPFEYAVAKPFWTNENASERYLFTFTMRHPR